MRWFRRPKSLKLLGIIAVLATIAAVVWPDIRQAASGKIMLRIATWGWEGAPEAFKAVIDEFEKAHPDVRVELEYAGYTEHVQRLWTQIAARATPDVAMVNPDAMRLYQARGLLMPLDEFADRDPAFRFEDYYELAWEPLRIDGRLYAVPLALEAYVLYYDQDTFDAAGVPYPTDQWTYKQWFEVARRLTVRDGDYVTRYGLMMAYNPAMLMVSAEGGHVWDPDRDFAVSLVDRPEAIRAVERLRILFEEQVLIRPSTMDALGGDAFRNGNAAMSLNGTWYAPMYAKVLRDRRWAMAIPPAHPQTGFRPTLALVDAFVMFRATKHPKLAWELMKSLVDARGQKLLAAPVQIPAMRKVAEGYFLKRTLPPQCNGQALLTTVHAHARPIDTAPVLDWLQRMHQALEPVWRGDQNSEEACRELSRQFTQLGRRAAARQERFRRARGRSDP